MAESEERTVLSRAANYSTGRRAVGGRLRITSERLIFRPHVFDRLTGGRGFETPLSAITGVGVAKKDGSLFSGGARDRLRVTLADGSDHLFVVNRRDELIALLDPAAQSGMT